MSGLFKINEIYHCFFFYFPDIDECVTQPCGINAKCTDNKGSYDCQCLDGYIGDGFICSGKLAYIHVHVKYIFMYEHGYSA